MRNARESRVGRCAAGFVALVTLVALGPHSQAQSKDNRRPNVVILVGDDHRAGTLGIDGDPHNATPHLDALARQGARFNRAYCNAPVCTASRQSFITGRLPHATGVTLLKTALSDHAVTLGDWLQCFGYDTAAFGKMHFNGPSNHGFTQRLDMPDWNRWLRTHPPAGGDRRRPWHPFVDPAKQWLNAGTLPEGLPAASMNTTYFANEAIRYIKSHRDRPYLLVVGFNEPHSPFRFPREWAGRFKPEDFPRPSMSEEERRVRPLVFRGLTESDAQGIQAAYYSSVSFLDDQIGRVVHAIDESGQAENTVVIYFGDHGYMLGEHGRFEKHCFYEPAVRLPLIVRWSGRLPANRAVDDMVELVDVVPTVLDLAGIVAPSNLHGQTLTPLMKGEPGAKGHDLIFSEYLENEEAMIRSDRYKLVVGTGRRARLDGYHTDLPLTGPYERLYDMQADPNETHDLSTSASHVAIKNDLLGKLRERLVSTRDPRHPVPPGLSPMDELYWCLVPRDEEPPARK